MSSNESINKVESFIRTASVTWSSAAATDVALRNSSRTLSVAPDSFFNVRPENALRANLLACDD